MPLCKGSIGPDVIDIRKLYTQTGKLMGFGHRVYKNYDPRAKPINEMIGDPECKIGLPRRLFVGSPAHQVKPIAAR